MISLLWFNVLFLAIFLFADFLIGVAIKVLWDLMGLDSFDPDPFEKWFARSFFVILIGLSIFLIYSEWQWVSLAFNIHLF
jgi:hypothetical protein